MGNQSMESEQGDKRLLDWRIIMYNTMTYVYDPGLYVFCRRLLTV